MTNEALALQIRSGRKELLSQLWEQAGKLVCCKARGYYVRCQELCSRAGVTLDDLIQAGFFALLDAVKAFAPARGFAFLTYLNYPLLTRWNAMTGQRTRRKEPLNDTASLDTPIGGEDDTLTIADTISDEKAAQQLDDVMDGIYLRQLHDALEDCINTLPKQQADVIRARYYQRQTMREIADKLGKPLDIPRTLEQKALHSLRYGKNASRLKPYREDIISSHSLRGGLGSFLSNSASSVERTVEWLEQKGVLSGKM